MVKGSLSKISLSILGITIILLAVVSQWKETAVSAKNTMSVSTMPAKSLCTGNEQTIWSCSTTKNKIASVCASKGLTKDKGYVQYRYGVLGNVELEFPKDRANSINNFKYSRYTRYRVTRLTLKFENQGYSYEIQDNDESDEKTPHRDASVEIIDGGGKELSAVKCQIPTRGSLMDLEDIVPRDEDAF